MTLGEKTVLVCHEWENTLEALRREFDHGATPMTNEVSVLRALLPSLPATKTLAEVMLMHQPTLDQHLKGTIDRRESNLVAGIA